MMQSDQQTVTSETAASASASGEVRGFWGRLWARLQESFAPFPFEDYATWRQRLTEKTILFAQFLVPVAMLVSVVPYLRAERYDLIVFNAVVFLWFVAVYFLRWGPIAPVPITALVSLFVVNAGYHLMLGPGGARPVWLTICVFFAATFYGMRGALIAAMANTIMLLLMHALIPETYGPWQQALSTSTADNAIFNSLGLTLIVGITTARLLDSFRRQLLETRKSQQQYRLLADHVTDVVWTMDLDLRFSFVSPSVQRLRGYTAEEVMTQSLSEVMASESLNEVMLLIAEKMQQAHAGDAAGWEPVIYEVEQPCKDGSNVFTRTHSKLVPDADGKPSVIVGVTHDLSEHRRAQNQQEELQAQLTEAQKMEAVGRLAGGVAHDFNNMLCVMSLNTTLALENLPADDPQRKHMEEISIAAQRASNLTKQLLAFSRKQITDPKVLDLSEVIEGMHAMLHRLIGEDVILQTVPREGLGAVRMDRSQAEQVVLNLAVNARDAMPDGGELRIETADVSLDQAYCARHVTARPGEYVMIAVHDTGSGMTAEVREKLFEPFFTTKEVGQGTGLGLATVFAIVQQSEGSIEVQSRQGLGSTFKVYFPRVDDEVGIESETSDAMPVGGSETILLVEDEEMLRRLAERLLRRLGYQVISSASAQEAITWVQEHDEKIDLLLTDVIMPHMNGSELAARLIELRPGLEVLYTSGYTDSIIAHHGVLDAGTHFMAKPYTLDKLAAEVRRILDGRIE